MGGKILGVNNIGIDSVYEALSTTISVDNKMGYKFQFSHYFWEMNLLYGLGISHSQDSLELEYVNDGTIYKKNIIAVDEDRFPTLTSYHSHYNKKLPIFLENYRRGSLKWYWHKYLEDEKILYVQLNGIRTIEENPLSEFCDSIESIIKNAEISALVLDLRNNGGGNTELNVHILKLMMSDEINVLGKSFTVIGCNTFSAAQNLTTILENYTETIFVGEPTGSKPHFIGEIDPFILPYSGLKISSSNVYHQHGYSTDTRIWTAPDVKIDFSFDDYKNGIDPVLEEVKTFLKN